MSGNRSAAAKKAWVTRRAGGGGRSLGSITREVSKNMFGGGPLNYAAGRRVMSIAKYMKQTGLSYKKAVR